MNRNFWANFSSLVSGIGTKDSPFTYQQIRRYFNPDIGDKCDIVPVDGDIIYAEGIIDLIDSDTVFSIKNNLSGKIIIKSKDLLTSPWRVETSDNLNNNIYLLQNISTFAITDIELRDYIICQKTGDGPTTSKNIILNNIIMASPINIEFRDFMVETNGNIKLSADENISVKCYGYSFIANNFTLSIKDSVNISNIIMYDGIVKANLIMEEIIPIITPNFLFTYGAVPSSWVHNPSDGVYNQSDINVVLRSGVSDVLFAKDLTVGATTWHWEHWVSQTGIEGSFIKRGGTHNNQTFNDLISNIPYGYLLLSVNGGTPIQSNVYKIGSLMITYFAGGSADGTWPVYPDGGAPPADSLQYAAGDLYITKENTGNLTLSGYKLSCWNTKMDGTGTDITLGSTNTITTGPLYLFPKWTVAYGITYDGSGNDSGTVPVDSNLYIPVVDYYNVLGQNGLGKTGYNFAGWVWGGGNNVCPGDIGLYPPAFLSPIVFSAIWVTGYSVLYDRNGADAGGLPLAPGAGYGFGESFNVSFNDGGLSGIPLTKSGKSFAGWNDQEDGNGTDYPEGSEPTMGNANLVLYAKWVT